VIRNRGFVNAPFLAIEYIERYRDRETFYPRHAALAEEHLSWFFARSCERLGMQDLPSGKPIEAEKEPSLMGLISLAPAGLLHPGEPEKAYRAAFTLDFLDIGYARDATAMLAAMIAAGAKGGIGAREMVQIGLRGAAVLAHRDSSAIDRLECGSVTRSVRRPRRVLTTP
jgi:hypothetical protein